MAVIKLQLESNAQDGIAVVNQLGASVADLNNETQTFAKTSQASFTKATNEAEQLTDQIKKGTESTKKLKEGTEGVGAAGSRVKQLKKEIKDLTDQAFKAGEGTELFKKKLQEAGALTDELGDLNASLNAVAASAGEQVAGAFGEVASIGIAGFEGVTAASSLLGLETENVEKQLLKLKSLEALGKITKEFAGLGDKITEIKLGLSPVTESLKEFGQSGLDTAKKIGEGYTNANQSLLTFGKDIKGNIGSAFKSIGSNISGFFTSFGSGVKGFFTNFGTNAKGLFMSLGSGIKNFATAGVAGIKSLGAALAANPLGVLLVVIGAVIGIFVALKDKVKPVAAVFEFLGDVVDWVGDKLHALGEILGLVASEAEERAQKVVDNVAKETEAIEKRYGREIKLAQAAGKDTEKLERDKLATQIVANKKALASYEILKKEKGELDKEELEKIEKLNSDILDAQTDLQASFIKTDHEAAKKREEEAKKRAEEQKKRDEERKKNLEALNAALLDLEKKSEQAILNTLSGKARLDKQRQISNDEIKELQKAIEKKSKEAGKGGVLEVAQLEQLKTLKTLVEKDYQDGLNKLAIEGANARAQALSKEVDNEIKAAELRTKLQISAIEATTAPEDATKDEAVIFEQNKQLAILKIQKDAAIESFKIQEAKIDAEANLQQTALDSELLLLQGKEDAISKARQAAIAVEKEQIRENAEASKQILFNETQKTVNEFYDKTNEAAKKAEENPNSKVDLAKMFGITDPKKQEQFYKDLNTIGNGIQDILSKVIDAQIAENERAIDSSKEKQDALLDELSVLEEKLSGEQALKEEGFANDTNRTLAEIEAKKKAIEAEKKREAELIEERKKIAKQQLIIDASVQASQMLTAGANLFAQGSTLGPIGIAAAIVSIAAMAASFLALKNQLAAINSGTGFERGGYTGDIGTKEVAGHVHGKEFVMKAKDTEKYFDLFQGIHTGDRNLMREGIADLLKDTGVILPLGLTKEIKANKEGIRSKELTIMTKNNNSGIEDRLDKLEEHLSKLVKQGDEETNTLPDGSIIKKKGTHTTRIRDGRK